jgi:hypothetical protein
MNLLSPIALTQEIELSATGFAGPMALPWFWTLRPGLPQSLSKECIDDAWRFHQAVST